MTTEEKEERIKVSYRDWRNVKKEEMWESTGERIEAEGRYKGTKYFNNFYEKEKRSHGLIK